MSRFFVSPHQIKEDTVEILGEDIKHIIKVLRLEEGSEITVLDNSGLEYLVKLNLLSKDKVVGQIIAKNNPKREAPIAVNLVQGLPKGDKMELIIQKCTELGINSIKPVNTQRSVVKLDCKKAEQRIERWQKIAQEAAEQSRRTIVPEILRVKDLVLTLKEIKEKGLVLIPWESEKSQGIKEVLREHKDSKSIFLVVGPEGGFSPQEIEMAVAQGAYPVSLGPRILRTETAGLAALTMVLYELGDLGGR